MITFTKPRTENGTKIIEVKASEAWDAVTLLRIYRRNAKAHPPRQSDPGWGVEDYRNSQAEWWRIHANPKRGLTLREAKDLALTLASVDQALWTETAVAWWEWRQARKENP